MTKNLTVTRPSVMHFRADVPSFFRYELKTTSPKKIIKTVTTMLENNRDLLNSAVSRVGNRTEELVLLRRLKKQKQLLDKKCNNKSDPNYILTNLRLELAMVMLAANTGIPLEENILVAQSLNQLTLSLADENSESVISSEELLWYKVALTHYITSSLKKARNQDIEVLMHCVDKFTDIADRKVILYFILEDYKCLAELPDESFVPILNEKFAEFNTRMDALHVEACHRHVERQFIQYSQYYDYFLEDSDFNPISTVIPIEISKKEQFNLEIDTNKLRKFAAHLYPPSLPIFGVNVPGFTQRQLDETNSLIHKQLFEVGICDTRGVLLTNGDIAKGAFSAENIATIQQVVIHAVEEKAQIPLKEGYKQKVIDSLQLDIMIAKYNELDKFRQSLAGFKGMDALLMVHKCLIEHQHGLPLEMIHQMKRMVSDSAKLYYHNKTIHKDYKKNAAKQNKELFNLAQTYIARFLKSEHNMSLIKIGTPIKENKKHSNHAFYAVLKKKTNEAGEQFIQVSIVNCNRQAREFHDSVNLPNDTDIFKPVVIQFHPNDMRTNLSHYLYRLLTLEFTESYDDKNEERHPQFIDSGYFSLMENIYLKKRDVNGAPIFHGYNSTLPFSEVSLSDSPTETVSQFTGNCTVHNLKKALQTAFELDVIGYGTLEETLILGFEQMVGTLSHGNEPQLNSESDAEQTEMLTGFSLVKEVEQSDVYVKEPTVHMTRNRIEP